MVKLGCNQGSVQFLCCKGGVLERILPVENMSTVPEGLSQKGDENLSVGVIVRTAGGGNIC